MKKILLAFTADTLQKIGIAGIALGIYQQKPLAVILGGFFLAAGYGFKIWEARQ